MLGHHGSGCSHALAPGWPRGACLQLHKRRRRCRATGTGNMRTLYPAPSRALIRRRRCAASVWDFARMSCLLPDVRFVHTFRLRYICLQGECTSELAACMFAGCNEHFREDPDARKSADDRSSAIHLLHLQSTAAHGLLQDCRCRVMTHASLEQGDGPTAVVHCGATSHFLWCLHRCKTLLTQWGPVLSTQRMACAGYKSKAHALTDPLLISVSTARSIDVQSTSGQQSKCDGKWDFCTSRRACRLRMQLMCSGCWPPNSHRQSFAHRSDTGSQCLCPGCRRMLIASAGVSFLMCEISELHGPAEAGTGAAFSRKRIYCDASHSSIAPSQCCHQAPGRCTSR